MFPSSLNYKQGNSVTQLSIVKLCLWTYDIISNLLLHILFDNLKLIFMLYFLDSAFKKYDKLGTHLCSVNMQLFFPYLCFLSEVFYLLTRVWSFLTRAWPA